MKDLIDFINESIQTLLELRVVTPYGNEKKDYTTVLVIDGFIILRPGYYEPEDFDDISEYAEDLGIKNFEDRLEIFDKTATDVFYGHIDNHKKVLEIPNRTNFHHSPRSSILVKKIVNQLKLKGATTNRYDYDELTNTEVDANKIFKKKEIQGKLPDIMYHGTSSSSLQSILKKGLVPGGTINKSNFPRVAVHRDVVSLSDDISQSAYFARNASKKDSSLPIILGFSVPDKSKIIPDYDVDLETGQDTPEYAMMGGSHPDPREGRGSYKTSLDVGVIAYKGRIPPSFIQEVYYWNYNKKKWMKTNIKKLLKIIEKWEDLGM